MGTSASDSGLRSSFARREQPGSILVLTALMMVVLLGFVGLVIDVGHRMDVYRQTQNAADAAALAWAHSYFKYTDSTDAQAAATLLVQQNGPSDSNLTLTCFDPTWNKFACNDPDGQTVQYVQAEVSSTFPNFFIPVLGFGQSSVGSKAVAEVNSPGGLVQ